MQNPIKVIDCYDKTAKDYAQKFYNELENKPLDQLLLKEFARRNQGPIADFGCGPGQTTRFLRDQGIIDLVGIDISPSMVDVASTLNPDISFKLDNLLDLNFEDSSLQSAIAFYSIVHFDENQLLTALGEIHRVLRKSGEFLFSFHIGKEIIHHNEFLGREVNVDFYFFETDSVLALVKKAGFKLHDVILRYPYPDIEYPSKRAYIWLKK